MVVATYSITDARKEKVSFAGPYFIAGQDLLVRADDTSITGPDSLEGQEALLGHRVDLGPEGQGQYPGVQLQEFATYSECLPALANKGVDALTTDDTILAGFAAQPRVRRQVQGRRQAVLRGEVRRRPEEGRHRAVREGQRGHQQDGPTAAWQKAIDENLGPAGYKPGAGNPPTPAACS